MHGEISVYVAVPETEAPWPAALVISDASGMTDHLRNQVDWLASLGYLAAAPDLMPRAQGMRCLFSTMRQALKGAGAASDDFETVRRWLADHEASTGRVAVAGFCFDGGFALLLAGSGAFDAVGSSYGGFTGGALATLAKSCPVVGKQKARLHGVKKDPAEIEEVLWAHSIPHDLEAAPEAGYSFVSDGREPAAPWALITGEMSTAVLHTPASRDARRRIRSFFATNMAR